MSIKAVSEVMSGVAMIWNLTIDALAVIAAMLLGIVMILVSIAVVSRYFFGDAQAWVIEMAEYILLYSTLLGSPWLLRRDGHTKVDIVLNLLSPRHRALLNAYCSVLGTLVCMVLLYYSVLTTYSAYERELILMKIFNMPKFVPLAVIPFGSFFLTIEFMRRAARFYRECTSIPHVQPEFQKEPAVESH